jgi:hypothetical protein
LIEEPELDSDDEDEDDYDSEDEDDEESVDDSSVSVAGPGLEAHMLRGFRWLFQRVEDEDDDDSDGDSDVCDEYLDNSNDIESEGNGDSGAISFDNSHIKNVGLTVALLLSLALERRADQPVQCA